MDEEKLKNKCKERAKIFQQAMESCKSSNPMDCIEWFADRIADLEKKNAELKSIADFQTSSNMDRYFKLKRSKEQLTKAKDLLLRFIELKNKPCAVGHSVNMLLYDNICAEAEQFLNSEVEK